MAAIGEMVGAAFKNLLRQRAIDLSLHFKRLFRPEGGSRDAEIVLAELRDFCRAETSTFSHDPYQAARLAGRREVWLRIAWLLELDPAEVRALMELDHG